ncbi:MAG TPA: YbgC/FadM family acyl-CoA thioesterase [Coxiellaceae bacterium]|nr:YbgC/FadM family acyl-CoA thioesterase [Coxiellaceae bacterium]
MNPFRITLTVYTEDTDYGGVVYHPNYFKYMERARTEWLNHIGYSLAKLADEHILFVLRLATLEFIKPAKLNDILQVTCRISDNTRTQLWFEQSITRQEAPETLLTLGKIQLVCINTDFKPIRIPEGILEASYHAR